MSQQQQQQSQFDKTTSQERSYAPAYYQEGQAAPREVNRDPREQSRGPQEYSYEPIGPDGYSASYGQGEKLTPRPTRRSHRGRNLIIGIIIVLALLWGAGATVSRVHGPMNMQAESAQPQQMTTSSTFTGSSLVFHGVKGNVNIHAGDTSQVQVMTYGNIGVKGSTDNGVITLQETQSGKPDLGSNDGGGIINVTVPKNMDISVDMAIGPVNIDGVTGKFNINAADGAIIINNTTLQDGSKLQTANGPIRFNGSLDPSGSYDFETVNGEVSLLLPRGDAATVSTNTMHGDINNHLDTPSNAANAANVTIKTLNGDISVDNQ